MVARVSILKCVDVYLHSSPPPPWQLIHNPVRICACGPRRIFILLPDRNQRRLMYIRTQMKAAALSWHSVCCCAGLIAVRDDVRVKLNITAWGSVVGLLYLRSTPIKNSAVDQKL
jgi:hypothetical protein